MLPVLFYSPEFDPPLSPFPGRRNFPYRFPLMAGILKWAVPFNSFSFRPFFKKRRGAFAIPKGFPLERRVLRFAFAPLDTGGKGGIKLLKTGIFHFHSHLPEFLRRGEREF